MCPEYKREEAEHSVCFSIIIAAYNVERYISKAIDSALGQKYRDDFEVVVVDDGSTDTTGYLCDEYARAYDCVRVLHQENRGLYEARKSGVSAALGDYCIFLDGDDLLHDSALKVIKDAIARTNADIVLFRMCRNKRFERDACSEFHAPWIIGEYGYLQLRDVREQLLVSDTINNLVTKAIKTECLKSFVDETLTRRILMAEDKLITSIALENAKALAFVDSILYYYRPNNESIMASSFNEARFDDLCTVHSLLADRVAGWGLMDCVGRFDALLIAQTCEEVSSLYKSSEDAQSKKTFLNRILTSRTFKEACKRADISSLSIHRRFTYRVLSSGNQRVLNAWMAIYNFCMMVVARIRGR